MQSTFRLTKQMNNPKNELHHIATFPRQKLQGVRPPLELTVNGNASQMQSTTESPRKACSRSHDAVIRVYDAAGNVIETHEHTGRFQRAVSLPFCVAPAEVVFVLPIQPNIATVAT
jgi:hypothetical protein